MFQIIYIFSTIEERFKSCRREAGETPLREAKKVRVRVRVHKPTQPTLSSNFCRLYKFHLSMMEAKVWTNPPLQEKSTSFSNYSCIIHRHVQIKKLLCIMDDVNVH